MGTIHHCGDIGMGQVAKLANQGLILGNQRLVNEARKLGRSYGIDLEILMNVLSQSTGTSFVLENWDTLASQWPHLQPLAQKDLALVLGAARDSQTSMPLTETRGKLPWDMDDDV